MTDRPALGKRPNSNDAGVSPPPKRKQQSTTTSELSLRQTSDHPQGLFYGPGKAVANFFTPLSKKEPEQMTWRTVKDSLLVGAFGTAAARSASNIKGKRKIAAFDFVRQDTIGAVPPT